MKNKMFTTLVLLFLLLLSQISLAQIPFEISKNGHITIKATINGVEGKFIFDTGAGLNVVFSNFSKKINHDSTHHFFVGHRATGEELTVNLYNAASFEIYNTFFEGQEYAILDMDFGDIDGLISLQPFRNKLVTIDYNQKLIYFPKKVKSSKSIDIQLADYAEKALDIFTNVLLNDSLEVQIMLDSGSGQKSFWFNSRFLTALGLDKMDFKEVPITSDFNKKNNYYIGKLQQFSLPDQSAKQSDINVAFVDGLIYEGKTSIEWLGNVITIDLLEKKIYISE
jgi:hypothetical protein